MIKGFRFRIDQDRARFFGISFGYGDSDPYIIDCKKEYFVLRDPGSYEWAGLGMSPNYHPAKWYLVKTEVVEGKADKYGYRIIEVIAEAKPGKKWREIKKAMIEKMNKLCK